MFWHSSFTKHLSLFALPALLFLAQQGMQAAPLTVMASATPAGVDYLFDFAITNQSAADPYYNLASVDFSFPAGTVIGMASAPAGNGETTDPSGDFVEFSSDNLSGFPLGMTVDGFQFTSASEFSSFAFTANYLDSTGTMLTTYDGTTNGPQASAVPEPGTWGLLAGASLLLFSRLRLRRAE